MKRILLYTLTILLLSAMPATQGISAENDSIRLSLLTCAPGEEIYSLFGHTAIRYENPTQGIDVVFNYGLINFNAPNFVLRFTLGETDYEFGAIDYSRFAAGYEYEGRSVWQQTLNLNPKEKQELIRLLEENYRPENRVYRYNFFYDNCSTRPRDKIEESIQGKIIYPENPADGARTYRDIVHQYAKRHAWDRFGMDFCLGSEADRPITRRQMMFAPFYLMNFFSTARIVNGKESKPLVISTEKIIDASPLTNSTNGYPSPLRCALMLFILVTAVTIYGIRQKKSLWGIDVLLFTAAGAAGCVIAFLALLSQHPAVSYNYLLFVFHPGHLLFLPYILHCLRKGIKCRYHLVNFIVLTLFILLFLIIPQRFDFAIVPLALCLLVRSASNLILTYKKKR